MKNSINTEEQEHPEIQAQLLKDKLELGELAHEKRTRLCREDPAEFIQYINEPNPKWRGTADLHRRWHRALSSNRFVLLIEPRFHGKTTQVPVGRVVWELGKNPNLMVKIICENDNMAMKRLSAVTDHIEHNPRVHEVFPALRPSNKGEWSKTRIYIHRSSIGDTDPSVEACGVLSTATGGRADLLIFDDPVDFRNAIEHPKLRATVKEAYKNVWLNMTDEESSRVWYIATPWHEDDLTHELIKGSIGSAYAKLLECIDEDFTPLWEERWPKKALMAKLGKTGRRSFDRAFRMKALSDEDILFPEWMIYQCMDDTFKFGQLPLGTDPKTVRYFMGVDFSGGKQLQSTARQCIFVLALVGNYKVPMSITLGKYTAPQFARLVLEVSRQMRPEVIYCEGNAQQNALIQWIQEIAGEDGGLMLPIQSYFTGTQKQDETIGLPGMAVEMEHGSWKIPDPRPMEGNKHTHIVGCGCGLCEWIQELKQYPIGKYKDALMASWFAREAARNATGRMPRIFSMSGDAEARIAEEKGLIVRELSEEVLVGTGFWSEGLEDTL